MTPTQPMSEHLITLKAILYWTALAGLATIFALALP